MPLLLAAENIRTSVVRGLRNRGIDVVTAREAGLEGAPDLRLVHHARENDQVLLTQDDDVLRLVQGISQPGVIYQTTQYAAPGEVIRTVVELIDSVPPRALRERVLYVP